MAVVASRRGVYTFSLMTLAFNEPKYQIESSDFRCGICEKEISCESTYYSAALYQEEAFRRRNFCVGCWQPTREGLFAYWRTKRPSLPTDPPKKAHFDTAVLLEFFQRLGEHCSSDGPTQEEKHQLRFVLALLLMRKKILHFESSYQVNGTESLKLTEKQDPTRVYWIRNPELTDTQLEGVKVQMGELLQMQL